VQQLFAAEESFAPFIEAVEEAAGSEDPHEQQAAEHAATVVAESAPAAVDGMGTEVGGIDRNGNGTSAESSGKGAWKAEGGVSLLSAGSMGDLGGASMGKQDDTAMERREDGSGPSGESICAENGKSGTNVGRNGIPVPEVVEQPTTEMRESWVQDASTQEKVDNVLRAGSVSGMILGEAQRKADEENKTTGTEDDVPLERKGNGKEGTSGTLDEEPLRVQRHSSGLRHRNVHRNGSGRSGVDQKELEAQAVQSAPKEPDRGEETREEAGMDLESRNRRREYLQRYRFLWDDQLLEVRSGRMFQLVFSQLVSGGR
jgi:hypothetical protein